MDPAIINYSKHNDCYLNEFNEKGFGEYFIGSKNKENKNTLNNDKQNINDNYDNYARNNFNQNNNNNTNNNETTEILTPLNVNTKLSFAERTVIHESICVCYI